MKYIVALAAVVTVASSDVSINAQDIVSSGSQPQTVAATSFRDVYKQIAADAQSGQFTTEALIQRIDQLVTSIDAELAAGKGDQLELTKVRNATLKVRDQVVAAGAQNGTRLIQINSTPLIDAGPVQPAPQGSTIVSDKVLSTDVSTVGPGVGSINQPVVSTVPGSTVTYGGGSFSGGVVRGGGLGGGGGFGGGGIGRLGLLGGIGAAVAIPLSVDDDDDDNGSAASPSEID